MKIYRGDAETRRKCVVELVTSGPMASPKPIILPERFIGNFREMTGLQAYELGLRAGEYLLKQFRPPRLRASAVKKGSR